MAYRRGKEMTMNGLNKTAHDVMNTGVVTTTRGTSAEVLARQLLFGQFSGLPVVEEEGEVVGVVTEFDVLEALVKGKDLTNLKAEEIMSSPPVCVTEETPVLHLLQIMLEHIIVRLPVVRNRKLVGIISRPNVLSMMMISPAPTARILPLCYWCEKVCDDQRSRPGEEVWCDLQEYLHRHNINSADVNFAHRYCPECLPRVNALMLDTSVKAWEE
jgi:CBS domain-containing protein